MAQELSSALVLELEAVARAGLREMSIEILGTGERLVITDEPVFVGAQALPTKDAGPALARADFYSYDARAELQVVIDIGSGRAIEAKAVVPGSPRLAASELREAEAIVRASEQGAAVLERWPNAAIEFGVTTIPDPDSPRFGHRLARVLYHIDHSYLTVDPSYVDLTTKELVPGTALGGGH